MDQRQHRMRPLKVTAVMAGEIAGEVPMLDGLMEWVMLRHMPRIVETRNGHRHRENHNQGHRFVPIPLGARKYGEWWIPCASSPIYKTRSDRAQRYARPMMTDATILGERKKLNTSSGPHKSCHLPLRCRSIDRVVWFVVGRSEGRSSPAARVRQVLKRVHAIGSKTAHGYGRVSKWIVEACDEDWSHTADSDAGTVLMRPLPVGDWLPTDLIGAAKSYDRPRAPYHDKTHACEVVKPC